MIGPEEKFFLPFQREWLKDESPLRIMQKSRQIGASFVDAHDSVVKAGTRGARFDVWVSTRDEIQAQLYLEDCARWAEFYEIGAHDFGLKLIHHSKDIRAYVLQFANGRRIHCVSSNPNALAGKRGHVKLDEFALHQDQRMLYRVAKPVTQWGGTLSIISTHRGSQSVFSELIRGITERGNPMGWSLHTVPVQKAVEQGLVEKVNAKAGSAERRERVYCSPARSMHRRGTMVAGILLHTGRRMYHLHYVRDAELVRRAGTETNVHRSVGELRERGEGRKGRKW